MPIDPLINTPIGIDGHAQSAPSIRYTHTDSPTSEKDLDVNSVPPDLSFHDEKNQPEIIIVSGEDVSTHLLSLRDDGDSPLTFRSIFLATGLSAFAAVMYQIYMVSRYQSS